MIKWGIIGAGNIAKRFCEALSNDEKAKLEAVSCRSIEKAEAFRKMYPCNSVYDDFQNILDNPDINAVYIALPHYYHYEWVKKAILAHKNVLVEKPAMINYLQAKEIQELAKKENVLVMEAMKNRFVPCYRKAKEILDDNIIGNISKIETSFCNEHMTYDENSYLFDLKQGGCLLDLGIYNISYLDDFFSEMIEDINVECKYHDCGVDCYVNAKIMFGKKQAIVECAIDRKKDSQVIFSGDKGQLILKPLHRPVDIEIQLNNGQIEKCHVDYEIDDFYSEISHFNDLIIDNCKESKIMSLDSTVNCAKILTAIKEKM